MKQIEIIISPTGATTVVTNGFSGAECQQASRFIEEALGRRINEKLTPDFYETSVQNAAAEQRQA